MGSQKIRGRLDRCDRGPRYLSLGVRLADPTQLKTMVNLSESFALACGVHAVIAQRSAASPGLLSLQFELGQALWQDCTPAQLAGPAIGITEGARPVKFALDPPHAGVFGETRSGKSITVAAIILALIRSHPVGDLEIVLVDPHADYAALANSAHLAMPIASEPDAIAAALEWTANQLAHRRANNLRNASPIALVVDEAQLVLTDDRNLAIVRQLGAEAAKFNIHLVVATQKPMERYMPGVLSNLGNRWVGLVADGRTSGTLTGQAGLACHRLTGHGDFVHVAGSDVQRLQVMHATPAAFDGIPRVEAVPEPVVELADTPKILNIDITPPAPGRPQNQIEPAVAAVYYHYGPEAITAAVAADQLRLSRRMHDRYRQFAAEFTEAKARLERGEQ